MHLLALLGFDAYALTLRRRKLMNMNQGLPEEIDEYEPRVAGGGGGRGAASLRN